MFVVKDYSVTYNSAAATIEAGTSTTFSGAVTGINGYTGGMQLYCPPDPPYFNITCTFTPATVNASPAGTPFSATITTQAATQDALKFFKFSFEKGAKMAEDLDYIPMPESVIKQIENTWSSDIKS